MFISLLFHKIGLGKYATKKRRLFQHLHYLKKHYPLIHPGQNPQKLGICLTFDDATYDFYHDVYPFLLKEKIPALLAVPAGYIVDQSSASFSSRLALSPVIPEERVIPSEGFCSWEEIRRMHQSKLIHIASHGMTHHSLKNPSIDLSYEIKSSKLLIEEKIESEVSSFVYPMGQFSPAAHLLAEKQYRYLFRIGSSINFSWEHPYQMVYRVPADNLSSISSILSPHKIFTYCAKYFVNRCRHR